MRTGNEWVDQGNGRKSKDGESMVVQSEKLKKEKEFCTTFLNCLLARSQIYSDISILIISCEGGRGWRARGGSVVTSSSLLVQF